MAVAICKGGEKGKRMFPPSLCHLLPHCTATDIHLCGHLAAGHIVLLAQNPCRHVCRTSAHGRELKAPAGKLIESDAAGGNLIDGTRNLIDWLGEVPVVHLDDGFPCLLDPGQDLLVLDLQFGISLCLLAYLLPEGVLLTWVGRHIC